MDQDRYLPVSRACGQRNLAERGWAKLKAYRRVATRCDKTARNFLAFLHVAPIMILLR